MILGDLIKEYRTEHGMSMDAFAKASGLSKAYVSLLEKNKHPQTGKPIAPSIDVIKKVADAMGKEFDFVFNMIDSDIVLSPKQNNPPKTLPSNIIPLPETKKIPLLGAIACGEPILAVENVAEYVDMDCAIHATFALRCKGDSMINARIFDGDIVYIREQPTVENGEIAAVLVNGTECEAEATLKRVYLSSDTIRLCAENPMYTDLIFYKEDMNKVKIIGKAVAFLSAVR